ncbi:MAG TPA: ABC transporter permease subunit/CPBP intramembrane protease [Thermoguttaceae bacterium]|nr:ABC transporter permease subunit/CPBP intramembrane protease [Thermoguttaceae bacterium]
MKWSNVRLILSREIRDQLRDRRTLFMIVVLPLLLYPLLAMCVVQVSQFRKEHATKVFVIGAHPRLLEEPALFENNRFAARLFSSPEGVALLELKFAPETPPPGKTLADMADQARQQVAKSGGPYDAAVYFPSDFAEQLERFRQGVAARTSGRDVVGEADGATKKKRAFKELPPVPRPDIIFTSANEKSQMAGSRVLDVLQRWGEEVGRANLSALGLSPSAAKPIEVAASDLAEESGRSGSVFWAKLLPLILLLWALTGAFYPAVDLCAGEKERGTLETLLSSPAQRSEIVVGKLVTIMIFSMITAILNMGTMSLTGGLLMSHMPIQGAPSLMSFVWLFVALVPMSALFSALCLALASLARSTKEGQYYLMPLVMICMPLALVPLAPGVELTLGNSLIPVTNVVLLLRTLLEGDYATALRFALPVIGMTLLCCLLAIRWAVEQFNKESVLFRESERLDVGLWLQHLFHDRRPTPTVAMAVLCGLAILVFKFFLSLTTTFPESFGDLVKIALVTQVVVVAPALVMTFALTSHPLQTLSLGRGSWRNALVAVFAAIALAVAIHPVAIVFETAASKLYPTPEGAEALARLFGKAPNFLSLLLLIAVVPPICEELAFRGFILSGLRHTGRKWRAIVVAAVFFGMTHAFLQQQLAAVLIGVVIGYLAVQSGNLLPCIAYHMVHNGLMLSLSAITPKTLREWPFLNWMVERSEGGFAYHWVVVVAGGMAAALILTWFSLLTYQKTDEERLQDAIRRGIKADDEPLASSAM